MATTRTKDKMKWSYTRQQALQAVLVIKIILQRCYSLFQHFLKRQRDILMLLFVFSLLQL